MGADEACVGAVNIPQCLLFEIHLDSEPHRQDIQLQIDLACGESIVSIPCTLDLNEVHINIVRINAPSQLVWGR